MNNIANDIRNGKYDDQIKDIRSAINDRYKLLRQKQGILNICDIQINSLVKLKDLKPKYLNGHLCKVLRIEKGKIVVRALMPLGRFGLIPFAVPPACVEIIENKEVKKSEK